MPKTTTYSSSIGTRSSFGCISDKRRTVLRITLAAFAVLLVFSLAAAPASAVASGNWVEFVSDDTFTNENISVDGNTFTIKTAYGLAWVAKDINTHTTINRSKTFVIANEADINLGDHYWTPIGTWSGNEVEQNPFNGIFEGNGKTISGLYINNNDFYRGLFGYTDGATIKNLGVIGENVIGKEYVGGLVGYNKGGNITNCYATGMVLGKNANVGGLVGYNEKGNITYCYATGAVEGKSGTVTNPHTGTEFGGLVGDNNGGNITYCYATGAVEGKYNLGGLVGRNRLGGKIENCYATGAVIGDGPVGGLVGFNHGGTITYCYATGEVTGSEYVGGLAGRNQLSLSGTTEITKSVALNRYVSAPEGASYVGRVVGQMLDVTIDNCYAWKGMTKGPLTSSLLPSGSSTDNKGADATSDQVWANPEFYKTTLGWDISADDDNDDNTVWKIISPDDDSSYPLPYLKETLATRDEVIHLKPKTPSPPSPAPEQPSSGGSTDTGSGHYTEYPRTVTDGGHVSFGTSPIVTGVDMPEGVTGSVELITVVVTDTDGREFYATFEINAPKSADGEKSLIYFQLDLKKIEADGYTVKDVVLSHNNEDGTWTDLKTTYLGTKDGKAKYSAENTVGYSVFAIYYTDGASIEDTEPEVTATVIQTAKPEPTSVEPAYVEPTMPSTVPTPEQTKSPVGLVGLGLGLLGAFAVLRRK